jgi:hypothetical protein
VDTFSDPFEHDYADCEPIEFSVYFDNADTTASQALDDEVETWARRALATNGLGDY